MINEKQIERLSKQEDFRAFLDHVSELREGELAAVVGRANPQYGLGAIDAYKKVLDIGKYSEMLVRAKGL